MTKVILHSVANAGPKQTFLIKNAAELIEKVVNDAKFVEKVKGTKFSFVSRVDGKNDPALILPTILNGIELNTPPDMTIDLRVELRVFKHVIFFPNHNTMGATDPGGPNIQTSFYWINRWIANNDLAALAGHLLHEWMHVAGYTHETSSGDPLDVAYAVGAIAENRASELLHVNGEEFASKVQ